MKKTLIFILIFCPLANAETFVKLDGEQVVQRFDGDCHRGGFCQENNVNISQNWREVPRAEYELAGSRYAKFEGGRVVEMNPVEKAALDILAAQASEAAEIAAHNAAVEQAKAEVDNPRTIPAMLNTCISAITTDEIREIKKGTPRAGKTDAQLKQTVKACLDTLKR